MKYTELIGQKFNRLTLLEILGYSKEKQAIMGKFICHEGNVVDRPISNVINGHIKSCGCLISDTAKLGLSRKHGLSKTLEYKNWIAMISRCYNPKNASYASYGGRGITVCDEWRDDKKGFENFLMDMGNRPTKQHSIERIEVDDNYYKGNCKWATPLEQGANKRNNKFIEYKGKDYCATELARELGINYSTFSHHLREGHTIEYMLKCKGKFIQRSKQAEYTKGSRYYEANGLRLTIADWSRKWDATPQRVSEYINKHGFEAAYHHYMNKQKSV